MKGKWHTASDDGGWNFFKGEVCTIFNLSYVFKGKSFVVFVAGLRFRYSKRLAAVNTITPEKHQKVHTLDCFAESNIVFSLLLNKSLEVMVVTQGPEGLRLKTRGRFMMSAMRNGARRRTFQKMNW